MSKIDYLVFLGGGGGGVFIRGMDRLVLALKVLDGGDELGFDEGVEVVFSLLMINMYLNNPY